MAAAILRVLLSVIVCAYYASATNDNCTSPGTYQMYRGDWPVAQEISDQANYLKGATWDTIESISKASGVSGCLDSNINFRDLNISDLITYVGYLLYKKQRLKITTRASVQTIVTDYMGGYGLAQGTVVCYADNNNATNNPYRCNMLAKPAQIVALTHANNISFTSGNTAYLGDSLNGKSYAVPGVSMFMSRRDLATDVNMAWQSDSYSVEQYNTSLPIGYTYAQKSSNGIFVHRADAEYVKAECEQQVLLQQSIASEITGGATFACVQWGNIQVYSFEAFAFEVSEMPCSTEVTVPYALFTISAFNKVSAQGYMTIYNGAKNSNPQTLGNVINTVSCFVTASNEEADQQALDVYMTYRNLFDPMQLKNLSGFNPYFTTTARNSNVSCSFAVANGINGGGSNVFAASEIAASRSLSSLLNLQKGPYGIVQPSNGTRPCRAVPRNNPGDGVGVQDSDFGKTVNNTVLFALSYTFNSKNILQYDTMAESILSVQSNYNYGSILTTCVATIIAGLSIPIFTYVVYVDTAATRRVAFTLIVLIELLGSNSAAIFMIKDLHAVNNIMANYEASDTSSSVYSFSYYNQNILVNVAAEMSGKVHDSIFKLVLLGLSMLIATTAIVIKWLRRPQKGAL